MLKFPMEFDVQASASDGMAFPWTAQANSLPPVPCAIPREFMGSGGGYSPEELFALAVLNCVIATYKAYCEKAKIRFETLEGKACLFVDRHEGSLMMTQVDLTIDVKGASDPEKARTILDAAIRDCAVSNSIKSGKTFQITVN